MPITKVIKKNMEFIDSFEEIKINEDVFSEKYILLIEGYSIPSNIGFIKNIIISGNNLNDAIFRAYHKIGIILYTNYNISINEMMVTDYKTYSNTITEQYLGFSFYTLSTMDIQIFREDEERFFMSCEDKIN